MNEFDSNIRDITNLDDDSLRASLKAAGWNEHLPAIKDEHGKVLVGHRRLKIAAEENITPVVKVVTFGNGPEADNQRIQLAVVSNTGAAPLTAQDRKRHAERMYTDGMTMEAIGRVLGVSQRTISEDLRHLEVTSKYRPDRGTDTLGRKKSSGRPKGSGYKSKKPADKPRAETAPQEPAKPTATSAPVEALDWQVRGTAHTAQRGAWTYFIRRDGSKRFVVSIRSGQSLPDKFVDMSSLELAKAHCGEHAAAHPVSDAAEIARLRARIAALEAAPPKPPKPPLDPESAAAREIKALKTRVSNLIRQLKSKDQREIMALAADAPFTLRGKIAKALNEQHTSVEARHTALQAWNSLGANNSSKAANAKAKEAQEQAAKHNTDEQQVQR